MANVNDCVRLVASAANITETEAQKTIDRVKDFRDEAVTRVEYDKLGQEIEAFAFQAGEEAEQAAIQARRRELIRAERAVEFHDKYMARAEREKLPIDKAIADEVWAIEKIQDGYTAQFTSRLIGHLKENPLVQKLCDGDREFRMEVYRAIEGGEAGPQATRLAELMREEVTAIRQALNDKGAYIMKRKVYGLPHKHNATRILADLEGHARMLLETLDWGQTFSEMAEVIPENLEAAKISLIELIQEHIVKGTEINVGPALKPFLKKYRRAASKFEHDRILVFKGPEGWAKYNERFGEGGILAGFYDHVRRTSATLAQMTVLGPSPEGTLAAAIEREKNLLRKDGVGLDRKTVRTLERLNRQDLAAGDGNIGRAWRMVSGADHIPENLTVARIMATVRQVITMSKLGGAVISSLADLPVTAMRLSTGHGYSLFEAWGETLRGFFAKIPPELRREMAGYIDVFCDGARGRLASRYDGAKGVDGALTRATEIFFRLNGLTMWTDNGKAGAVQMISHSLGRLADKGFEQLSAEMAHTMRRYGLDRHWDMVRKHLTFEYGGRKYIVPELARKIPDAEIDAVIAGRVAALEKSAGSSGIDLNPAIERMRREARRDIDNAVHGFFAAEVDTLILTPDARSRQYQTWGLKAGTLKGEIARSVMQFKGFSTAFIQKALGPLLRGTPGQSLGGRLGNLGLLMAQSTMFGYVAMELKRMTKGEKPYFASENPNWAVAAAAAFSQGGGAGIYGDFLMAETNRFGGGIVDTMVGPMGGLVEDVNNLRTKVIRRELRGADIFNFGLNHTPYINLFYSRAILDYACLYSAREALSPGWLRRREANMKRDSGREYMWPPSRHRLRMFE